VVDGQIVSATHVAGMTVAHLSVIHAVLSQNVNHVVHNQNVIHAVLHLSVSQDATTTDQIARLSVPQSVPLSVHHDVALVAVDKRG